MLTEVYISALLANEELADHVWEAWDKGAIDDVCSAISWIIIADQKYMRQMSRLPALFRWILC